MTKPNRHTKFLVGIARRFYGREGLMLCVRQPLAGPIFESSGNLYGFAAGGQTIVEE